MITKRARKTTVRQLIQRALCLAGAAALVPSAFAGTWTQLTNAPPSPVVLMLLLSDGTVMCAKQAGTSTIGWQKLTPNAAGSYINGTWTSLANMHDTRLYFQTQVLRDGRVYCSGGEYGTGGSKAEIYDPTTNVWTQLTIPAAQLPPSPGFYDCNSELTPDGSVLLMPVFPRTSGVAVRYHPSTNTWSDGGHLFRGTWQDEASWVKLPDNSILTIDPFGTFSERYIPASNTWVNDGVVPVSLYDPFGSELGGALLLPNGKAFFLGSTGHTAIYTPTGTTSPGTWVAGPDIPAAHGTPDAPAAMMVTGNILCAVSPIPTSANHFPPPTTFYEYNYLTNSFTAAPAPVGASDNIPSYQAMMLDLPDGKVLYANWSGTVYAYTPTGSPIAAGKPTITTISANGDGSFHLVGTKLNGISEGATYGDDWAMNTNFPIVRIHHSNGNVYYARTYNWSSTGVQTGAAAVTTEYRPPAGMPAGAYTLVAVANGIASDAVSTPTITQPTSQTACYHGGVTLSVSASGLGPITYQWRRGTTNITNGGNISGATSANLVINPVNPANVGTNYNCVVSNALGSVTTVNVSVDRCTADFNCDGFVAGNDYDLFVQAFEAGNISADFDGDGFITGIDFDDYVLAFEAGC